MSEIPADDDFLLDSPKLKVQPENRRVKLLTKNSPNKAKVQDELTGRLNIVKDNTVKN